MIFDLVHEQGQLDVTNEIVESGGITVHKHRDDFLFFLEYKTSIEKVVDCRGDEKLVNIS